MKIVDAFWTKTVNVLVIECACGRRFHHRADRWKVNCPACGRQDHLAQVRQRIDLKNP